MIAKITLAEATRGAVASSVFSKLIFGWLKLSGKHLSVKQAL